LLALRFQQQSAIGRVEERASELELVSQMKLALASGAEAEKSAVLALTDEESHRYADQARQADAAVEAARAKLSQVLDKGGTPEEKNRLNQFSQAFVDLQNIDREVLSLAEKNTNIKASALAYGPAAAAIKEMDEALARIIATRAESNSPSSKKVMVFAAQAEASALRIQALLPPHIAEESDKKMDELEAAMTKQDQLVQKNLAELAALSREDPDVQIATRSYTTFTGLRKEIIALSRENTNVRSLSLSLNQKRKAMLSCQDALASLEHAIQGQRAPQTPPSPR
jgi:hypothetical protein